MCLWSHYVDVKSLTLRLAETESYLSESQTKNSLLESELYTRTAALEASTADSLLTAQELDGLRKQLANLHEALRQLQWRSERDLKTFHDTAGTVQCMNSPSYTHCHSKCHGVGEGHGHSVSGILILHACHPLCSHKHFSFAFALLTATNARVITPHTYSLIFDVILHWCVLLRIEGRTGRSSCQGSGAGRRGVVEGSYRRNDCKAKSCRAAVSGKHTHKHIHTHTRNLRSQTHIYTYTHTNTHAYTCRHCTHIQGIRLNASFYSFKLSSLFSSLLFSSLLFSSLYFFFTWIPWFVFFS